jgi:hypothetical protein
MAVACAVGSSLDCSSGGLPSARLPTSSGSGAPPSGSFASSMKPPSLLMVQFSHVLTSLVYPEVHEGTARSIPRVSVSSTCAPGELSPSSWCTRDSPMRGSATDRKMLSENVPTAADRRTFLPALLTVAVLAILLSSCSDHKFFDQGCFSSWVTASPRSRPKH